MAVHLVALPLAVGEEHLAPAAPLVLVPVTVVNGAIVVVEHASSVAHDLAHVLGAVEVVQLVLDPLQGLHHRDHDVLDLFLVGVRPR